MRAAILLLISLHATYLHSMNEQPPPLDQIRLDQLERTVEDMKKCTLFLFNLPPNAPENPDCRGMPIPPCITELAERMTACESRLLSNESSLRDIVQQLEILNQRAEAYTTEKLVAIASLMCQEISAMPQPHECSMAECDAPLDWAAHSVSPRTVFATIEEPLC